jgi:hypothetical protein
MSQLDPPNWPAKRTRPNVLPWKQAKYTREYDTPNSLAKDPPFPAQDPQAGHNSPASPPPPRLRQRSGGEGVGNRPGPPMHLVQVLLLSLTCLHILTGHNIYASYIERINKYKIYCFRRRKDCKEGVRSWSPPGPVKGSVLHNLEHYRRSAG